MSEQIVERSAVRLLKDFAEKRSLGRPDEVIVHDDGFTRGIGCQWGEDRNAFVVGPAVDLDEIKRRIEAW